MIGTLDCLDLQVFLSFFNRLVVNKIRTGRFHSSRAENKMIGPDHVVLLELGGLNTNKIRKGEIFRLFWSMWMHSGWCHIGFNILCQLQYLWMLEPDWGSTRTFVLFLIAGITGYDGLLNHSMAGTFIWKSFWYVLYALLLVVCVLSLLWDVPWLYIRAYIFFSMPNTVMFPF